METSSKVRPAKVEAYDGKHVLVRYDIKEVPDFTPEGEPDGVKYEYKEVLVPSDTVEKKDKGVVIDAIIRTKFSESAEIALAFGREKDAEKLAEHEAFKEQAEAWAEEILADNE